MKNIKNIKMHKNRLFLLAFICLLFLFWIICAGRRLKIILKNIAAILKQRWPATAM